MPKDILARPHAEIRAQRAGQKTASDSSSEGRVKNGGRTFRAASEMDNFRIGDQPYTIPIRCAVLRELPQLKLQ